VIWNNTATDREERLQKPAGEGAVDAIKDPATVRIDTVITPGLKREGLMREVIRHVQKARKDAGLDVDNRIYLMFSTDDKELEELFNDQALNTLMLNEVLAIPEEEPVQEYEYSTIAKIDGAKLGISLKKV
jgi:isoleucyl-tRNA synthetase